MTNPAPLFGDRLVSVSRRDRAAETRLAPASADRRIRAGRTANSRTRRRKDRDGVRIPADARRTAHRGLEAVLHGWDLATATGQDRAGDPDADQAALVGWYGNFPDEIRPATGMFGPSKAAADNASTADRLAAYFGRTV
ncbi:hypothetical protein ACFCXT_14755 [Streptomyces vinaceus]|uniref:hypothetical protein n=1 Tax=Streptomyces vinaceus TaxID=1960 RepID=UPI0035DF2255